MKGKHKKKKTILPKMPYSKWLMVTMIVICLQIIFYSEWIMWLYADLSSLYALVGIAAALAASIWAYCDKSKAENTQGGIVFESAMSLPEAPLPENPDKAVG